MTKKLNLGNIVYHVLILSYFVKGVWLRGASMVASKVSLITIGFKPSTITLIVDSAFTKSRSERSPTAKQNRSQYDNPSVRHQLKDMGLILQVVAPDEKQRMAYAERGHETISLMMRKAKPKDSPENQWSSLAKLVA